MQLLITLFFASFFISLNAMNDDNNCFVSFVNRYEGKSENIKIPSSKLQHFQLLQNLIDQGLEQPIELNFPFSIKSSVETLLKIISEPNTVNINRESLTKEYLTENIKTDLQLCIIHERLQFDLKLNCRSKLDKSFKFITDEDYKGIREFILSCAHNETVSTAVSKILWDGIDLKFKERQKLKGYEGVNRVGFDSKHDRIALGSEDGAITILENSDQGYKFLQKFSILPKQEEQTFKALAFDQQGNILIALENGTMQVWDKTDKSYELRQELQRIKNNILCIGFDNEHNLIVLGCDSWSKFEIWEKEGKNYRHSWSGYTDVYVGAVSVGTKERFCLWRRTSEKIELWEKRESGFYCNQAFKCQDTIRDLKWDSKRERIILLGERHGIEVWENSEKDYNKKFFLSYEEGDNPHAVDFDEQGNIFSAGNHITVFKRGEQRYNKFKQRLGFTLSPGSMAIGKEGSIIANSPSEKLYIYDRIPNTQEWQQLDLLKKLASFAYINHHSRDGDFLNHKYNTLGKQHEQDFSLLPKNLQEGLKKHYLLNY